MVGAMEMFRKPIMQFVCRLMGMGLFWYIFFEVSTYIYGHYNQDYNAIALWVSVVFGSPFLLMFWLIFERILYKKVLS